MSGAASKRIAEIVKELQHDLRGGAWQTEIGSTQMAILAIQRYLDELAAEDVQRGLYNSLSAKAGSEGK